MDFDKLMKYLPAVLISLVFICAGLILYFILRYGVDVPYNDQWEYVGFFEHAKSGTLTFKELFNFQGEYRQLFPNLIFVGLGLLTQWNVRYEMIVIFLMACAISYNVYRLAGYTLRVGKWQKWLVLLMVNFFIFSPCQYENWLFGVQIEYFMPILCVTSCMVVVSSGMNMKLKLLLCLLFSVISIYSAVNGLLCWFLIVPLFFVSDHNRRFFKKWWVIYIWIFFILITLKFYFTGYKTPVNFPSPFLFLQHPGEAIQYYLGVLGNPLRIVHTLKAVMIVGGALLLIFVSQIIYVAWHYKDKQLFRDAMVWIVLGLFSLATAAMITIGRFGFGLVQSLTPRYTTFSLYLIVAIIFLFAIIFQRYVAMGRVTHFHKRVVAVLILLLFYNGIGKYRDSVTDLKAFHNHIHHGKAGLLFIDFVSPVEYTNKIFPFEFKKLKKRAAILNSLGYLRPALLKSNIMQDMEGNGSGILPCGMLQSVVRLNDTLYRASGVSNRPNSKEPADAVLITCDNLAGKSVLLTLSNADSLRWTKTFVVKDAAQNPLTIRAWAFDADEGKAYRMGGSRRIAL
jgi:hypothetical protein